MRLNEPCPHHCTTNTKCQNVDVPRVHLPSLRLPNAPHATRSAQKPRQPSCIGCLYRSGPCRAPSSKHACRYGGEIAIFAFLSGHVGKNGTLHKSAAAPALQPRAVPGRGGGMPSANAPPTWTWKRFHVEIWCWFASPLHLEK